MKISRNKIIIITFAVQILFLFSVIASVYMISGNGRTVVLEMAGYDPYDALRGRYIRLDNPVDKVKLEPDFVERYKNYRGSNRYVYVVLKKNPDNELSSFSYATLDRPDDNTAYIKCQSKYLKIYDGVPKVKIYPRINQYYLNEKHAGQLDQSIRSHTKIHLTLKIWHGMYVLDGLEVDGQDY